MILISILIGCLAIYCVYSLSCYRCETTAGTIIDECATGPNYGVIENCESQLRSVAALPQNTNLRPHQCVKITGLDKYGTMFTARGCVPYDSPTCKRVVDRIGFFSDVEGGVQNLSCYPCKTNECNSSFTVKSCSFTVFIISIVILLYKL